MCQPIESSRRASRCYSFLLRGNLFKFPQYALRCINPRTTVASTIFMSSPKDQFLR
jgi:hypothetical protein